MNLGTDYVKKEKYDTRNDGSPLLQNVIRQCCNPRTSNFIMTDKFTTVHSI